MKNFLYLLCLLFFFSTISCGKKDGEDDNNTPNNNLAGSFQATIDGSNWIADSNKISVVIANFGSGPKINITAQRSSDTSYFEFLMPYFYGNDTSYVTPAATGVELRFIGSGYTTWIADPGPGNISISRTVVNGLETYTGTFSGNFKKLLVDSTKSITNGTFIAKRLL
jgi:hypothetical protein